MVHYAVDRMFAGREIDTNLQVQSEVNAASFRLSRLRSITVNRVSPVLLAFE